MTAVKKLLAAGVAAAIMMGASAASAATIVVPVTLNPIQPNGTQSGNFASPGIIGPFDADITWNWPGLGTSSVDISSVILAGADLNFTSVLFNGVALSFVSGGTGFNEYRSLTGINVTGGAQHLTVTGNTVGPNQATFTGNLLFAPGQVPEPATWAMMILGMGMVGMGLRVRRRQAAALA